MRHFHKKLKTQPTNLKGLLKTMTKNTLGIFIVPLMKSAMSLSRGARADFFRDWGKKVRALVEESDTEIDDEILDELVTNDLPAFLEGLAEKSDNEN
jgi:chemotaxis protein histidine kinase CheA